MFCKYLYIITSFLEQGFLSPNSRLSEWLVKIRAEISQEDVLRPLIYVFDTTSSHANTGNCDYCHV